MTAGLLIHVLMSVTFATFFGLSLTHIVAGMLISWLLLVVVEPVFDTDRYASRLGLGLLFVLRQLLSMIMSSLGLMFNIILLRYKRFNSLLITLPTKEYSDLEVMLASYAINLSPGSAVVSIDTKNDEVHIHMLDVTSGDDAKQGIIKDIFDPIVRFTR